MSVILSWSSGDEPGHFAKLIHCRRFRAVVLLKRCCVSGSNISGQMLAPSIQKDSQVYWVGGEAGDGLLTRFPLFLPSVSQSGSVFLDVSPP